MVLRLDVEFALQDGSSTNFSPDDMPVRPLIMQARHPGLCRLS